ncbi:MAG: PPOX class F420-dependent oxidoreductase [Chloroflexi bacterium]|nr:PPOX class F420-dependent oxidoreductase [Chloroflexota bacterium]
MSIIPEQYTDLLETRALAHLATIGPKGDPHSTPIWFGWDGNYVLLTLIKTAQKYQNLRRNPHLALSIVDPKNAYRYLEIRGRVVGIEEDHDRHFVNSMAKKYLNQEVYPWHRPGDEHVVVKVEPEHTTHLG